MVCISKDGDYSRGDSKAPFSIAFTQWRPEIEPQSLGPLANTLLIRPMAAIISTVMQLFILSYMLFL